MLSPALPLIARISPHRPRFPSSPSSSLAALASRRRPRLLVTRVPRPHPRFRTSNALPRVNHTFPVNRASLVNRPRFRHRASPRRASPHLLNALASRRPRLPVHTTFPRTCPPGRGTRQVNPGDEMRGSMGESHMAGGAEGSERDMIAEGPARSQEQVEDGNDRGEEGQRGMDRGGGAEGDGQRGRDRGGGTEGEGQGGRDRGGEGLLPAFSHLPSPE
ncbi:unnamed protein product [Closterium sp. NIES-64]|nr:unnamed protein product [Closterium sp. NIES-64]